MLFSERPCKEHYKNRLWSKIISDINQNHGLQVGIVFFGEYISIHVWWHDNGNRKQITPTPNSQVTEKFQFSTVHKFWSLNGIILCIVNLLYELWIISRGSPHSDHDAISSTCTSGLWAYNLRPLNDVTNIEPSYWAEWHFLIMHGSVMGKHERSPRWSNDEIDNLVDAHTILLAYFW